MREVMDRLAQRFPDDVRSDLFWDATTFVTATVSEVIRTLMERTCQYQFLTARAGLAAGSREPLPNE